MTPNRPFPSQKGSVRKDGAFLSFMWGSGIWEARLIKESTLTCNFSRSGYQMATKKDRKPLGRRGCRNCQILDGYQLATKGTFSYEKVPFFIFYSHFCNIFSGVRGVVLG